MEFRELKEYNAQALAYLGDVVWELYVREYFMAKNLLVNQLNKLVVSHVNAKKQSVIYLEIFDGLEERIQAVAKRARNGKIKSFPSSCSVQEYRNASAFEAVIGAFHLMGMKEEIEDILKKYVVEGG